MADKDGRTEKATPKRRKESRKDGNVPKSKEMGTFFSLLSFGITLIFFGEWFVSQIVTFQVEMLNMIELGLEPITYAKKLFLYLGKIFIYLAFLVLVFQFINQMLQVGLLFSPKIIKPDIKKLNPANYFKNLFSAKSLVEILKSIFIITVLIIVVYMVMKNWVVQISGGSLLPWTETLVLFWGIFKEVFIKILVALFFVAVLDFSFQKYDWEKRIRMKKQEIKDEHKENEGNPETKRRQRQAAMQMLSGRIRTEVPLGTVVITNPTHYSVVIRYKKGDGPPKVILKGIDHMALYIREVAKEHNVQIYEAPPLARELYKRVPEGEQIPQDLYQAMIDILKVLIQAGKIKV